MRRMKHGVVRVVLAVGIAAPVVAGPASARERAAVTVLADGLNGPFGLHYGSGSLYVAESDTGRVLAVDRRNGAVSAVVEGLSSPVSVDVAGRQLLIVTGEGGPPSDLPNSALLVADRRGGEPQLLADLLQYEMDNNPDGQAQFGADGAPLDALSNPFAVLEQKGRGYALVADAGANAVLSVDRHGNVSTFFVPPLVTTGACAGAPNNDPEHVGCDPVPTGLAYGRGNTLYVSTLSGDVPGEGRVYVLNARTGAVLDVISGFSGPTGVAVGSKGDVYVSEVFEGAPAGEPPSDFDPSTVGQIVRIDRDGTRSYAQVPMPTGLDFHKGTLYASTWSVAGFLGIADAGQVVAVEDSAFMA